MAREVFGYCSENLRASVNEDNGIISVLVSQPAKTGKQIG
jgi:hypothetical protein